MKILIAVLTVALLAATRAGAGSFEEEYGSAATSLSPKMRALHEQSQKGALKRQQDQKAGPPIAFDDDVDPAVRRQMEQDLAFVNDLQGTGQSKLHEQIFGRLYGPDYLRFFETRIKEVGMDDCGGGAGTVACVRSIFFPNKMWLTQNFVRFNQPQVSRVETVFHEARHTEQEHGGWPHATCPTPFLDEQGHDVRGILSGTLLEGKAACDTTELGAYATGMIMLKNIQKYCANCTDKVKMDAGIFGDDLIHRFIDARAKQALVNDLY